MNTIEAPTVAQPLAAPTEPARPAPRRREPETAAPAAAEYLSFRLGAETYGINILRVQEIRGYTEPARLANSPQAVKGVIDLRGTIVPVVDLRVSFGCDSTRIDVSTVMIIVSVANGCVGVVVDAVADVVALSAQAIAEAPPMGSGQTAQAVLGLARLETKEGAELMILLDIDRVLVSADMDVGLPSQARSGTEGFPC